MNKKLVGVVGAVCAVALGAYVVGGAGGRQQPPASPPGAAGAGAAAQAVSSQVVSTQAVYKRDVPVALQAAGTVVSLNTVELRPQVSSTVKSVAIKEGQFVRRGDLLFSFDDRPDRANLEKARAQLLRDQATLADLQRQWARAQELRAQNFIAPSAADTVLSQLEAQQAAVRADEAAVQSAEVALSYATLRSPLNGRAGAINVFPGSLVQPAATAALVTISQMDPIGVTFTVPEAQLAALLQPAGAGHGKDMQGAAPAAVPMTVGLPSAEPGRTPAAPLQGQLSFIDNAVDTTTGTIRLKGSVANPRQQLWPGQYVSVNLSLRTLKDALVVPQAAVIQRGNERSVYIVGADRIAVQKTVQLRYAFGEFAVVDGLAEGDRVVVEGKQNLRPGVTVREAAPAAAGRGASAAAVTAAGAAAASGVLPGAAVASGSAP